MLHSIRTGILVEDFQDESLTAGSKARTDVWSVFEKMGYERYFCHKTYCCFNALNYIPAVFRLIGLLLRAGGKRPLVVQYPFYTNQRFNWLFFRICPKRAILIVHDLNSLRYCLGAKSERKEVRLLNRFQGAVVHTRSMKKWLSERGALFQMEILEVFDYCLPEIPLPAKWNVKEAPTVIFAGNLKKSRFLLEFAAFNGQGMEIALYGPGASKELQQLGGYQGALSPDQLPFYMKGQYGLVWDGSEINGCSGPEGNYLRYNSPHKLSLYLAAGIPVIVWSESAAAKFVLDHGVGLAVASLAELGKTLAQVTPLQYEKMAEACRRLQPRLARGEFLRKAFCSLNARFRK